MGWIHCHSYLQFGTRSILFHVLITSFGKTINSARLLLVIIKPCSETCICFKFYLCCSYRCSCKIDYLYFIADTMSWTAVYQILSEPSAMLSLLPSDLVCKYCFGDAQETWMIQHCITSLGMSSDDELVGLVVSSYAIFFWIPLGLIEISGAVEPLWIGCRKDAEISFVNICP